MTQEELHQTLALVAFHLPTQVRTRFLALLPESLREDVRHLQDQQGEKRVLSVVEQALKTDLEMVFGEPDVPKIESEVLPLRIADVLSLVLLKGSPQQASDIVRRLPAEVEAEVVHLIAAQEEPSLARRLGKEELDFIQALKEALGLSVLAANETFAAEILRQIHNPSIVRRILTLMYDKDPDSTGHVQDLIFGFHELVRLPDRELQLLLNGVDHWDLILALRPAPVGLRRKVLANLSARRAKLLEEDEKVLQEVDDAQVMMLQHQILDRVRLLYESGVVHTYMGSVERDDVAPLEEASTAVMDGPAGGLVSHVVLKKKPRYALGLLVGFFSLVIAVAVLVWFARMSRSRLDDNGQTKPSILADETADSSSQTGVGFRVRQRSGSVGNAAVISGKALLMDGQAVRSADSGVAPGDRLQTDGDGRASVDLWAGSGQVQVGENTDIQFGEAQQPQDEPPKLDLRVGNVWVQVKNPLLEVSSPLASITASEGAIYHLKISLNATTTLTVHSGTVWVKSRKAANLGVLVLGAGERMRIETDGDVSRDRHNEPLDWAPAK